MSENSAATATETRRLGSTRRLVWLLLGAIVIFGLSTVAASGSVSALEAVSWTLAFLVSLARIYYARYRATTRNSSPPARSVR